MCFTGSSWLIIERQDLACGGSGGLAGLWFIELWVSCAAEHVWCITFISGFLFFFFVRSWQRCPKKCEAYQQLELQRRIESAAFQTLLKLFLHSFWCRRAGLDLYLLKEFANTDLVTAMLQYGVSWDTAKSVTPEHLRVNILISIMCLPRHGVAAAASLTFWDAHCLADPHWSKLEDSFKWRSLSESELWVAGALAPESGVSPQKCIVRARGCRDTLARCWLLPAGVRAVDGQIKYVGVMTQPRAFTPTLHKNTTSTPRLTLLKKK